MIVVVVFFVLYPFLTIFINRQMDIYQAKILMLVLRIYDTESLVEIRRLSTCLEVLKAGWDRWLLTDFQRIMTDKVTLNQQKKISQKNRKQAILSSKLYDQRLFVFSNYAKPFALSMFLIVIFIIPMVVITKKLDTLRSSITVTRDWGA